MSLIRKASIVCKEDHQKLPLQQQKLGKKRTLLIAIEHDNELVFDQLKYCIQLSSSIDLRIYKFTQFDQFVMGAILSLCKQFKKQIEVNIWVDKDLDVVKFVSQFKNGGYNSLIEFVYFRLDFKNWS
jgi:hypothetical protein